MRMEPPLSLPCAKGRIPAATAAAEPPLDPPAVRSRFHGLRVAPKSRSDLNDCAVYEIVSPLRRGQNAREQPGTFITERGEVGKLL
jgi:hypothetical protein